jgi:hypothetical protein
MKKGELTVYGRTAVKSIVLTYPDYQTLPRGVKRMLVASETSFFCEAAPVRSNGQPETTSYWPQTEMRMASRTGSCLGASGPTRPAAGSASNADVIRPVN